MTQRRTFLAQLTAGAAAFAFDTDELVAAPSSMPAGTWDTSWIGRVEAARYRVVFNASDIGGGAVLGFAGAFFDNFHEVHDTTDAQTRPVLVFRRLGTTLGFNDAMWDKYGLGESSKVIDPVTREPARRNVYWSGPGSSGGASETIQALNQRGMICLVCNVALGNVGRTLAEQTGRNVDDIRTELRANLVPGAVLVPSGIYALIRAQNAGCAYMPGT